MSEVKQLLFGEYSRKVDDRFRLSLPSEFAEQFQPKDGNCVIAKERPGCISLWDQEVWQSKLDARVELIQAKLKLGDYEQRIPELQMFGRLLSTRHRPLQLAGRGRLVLPEGFREFLGVEAGNELIVVGATVCIEIWKPEKWIAYVEESIPKFRKLLTRLSN
ncbi:MAG: division/cell wall cluster transcriptional repressor MraZ [Thermoguttaceae bacterium]